MIAIGNGTDNSDLDLMVVDQTVERIGREPEKVIPKIVEGQIKKWYQEVCLLDQPFVKENKKNVQTLLNELIAKIGENCKIRRFVRWEVGEGLTVDKKDFAEEIKDLTQ